HNGVIENYATLKRQLAAEGVAFRSDTDTEVIAQLIAHHLADGAGEEGAPLTEFIEAVSRSLAALQGTYGLAVVSPLFPGGVAGARLGSPLVVGIGEGEHFLASDPSALAGHTDKVVYLQDHQLCVLTADEWHLLDHDRERVEAHVHSIDWESADADKGVFDH